MKEEDDARESVCRDSAVAAAAVIIEEFFPHCPNGIVAAIGERLSEIVEAAIESALVTRGIEQRKPSVN